MSLFKQSIITGLSFGLTSGIITTLGLMVGLHSGTHSKNVVLAGILIIAISDALSDALGIHMSEESDKKMIQKDIWESTFATFISKLITALTFIAPVLLFNLSTAMIVGILWGLILIASLSFFIAKQQKEKPIKVIMEHIAITIIVITLTHYIGDLISNLK